MKKKYYAITTSMQFEKTVLIPVEDVADVNEAMDLVDARVDDCDINLLDEEALYATMPAEYTNEKGIRELDTEEARWYQIVTKEE